MTPWQHALLNAIDAPAFVCDADALLVAWNTDAARTLSGALRVSSPSPPSSSSSAGATARHVQLHGASLLECVSAASWKQLKQTSASSAVIAQINGSPRRLHARRLTVDETVYWLIRCETPAAIEAMPADDLLRQLIEAVRTPLASIRAAIETVKQYPGMGADAASQFTDVIASQSVRLSELIETTERTYTTLYQRRRALEPIEGTALLAWTRDTLRDVLDIPVAADNATGGVPPVRIAPQMLRQGIAFVGDRFVNATRCQALHLHLRAADAHTTGGVVLLDLSAEGGRTVTETRLDTWKQKVIPWRTSMMQLTLQALLDQHNAQLWVEENERGPLLRFAFPQSPASENAEA